MTRKLVINAFNTTLTNRIRNQTWYLI